MTTVTLSRGGTSVTFDLYESGGSLVFARDIGKPHAEIKSLSNVDPISRDHRSTGEQVVAVGQFVGSSAYSDAQSIVEDLVKPHSDGTDLTLDATNVPGVDSTMTVGVPSDSAVQVAYQPGRKDWVPVQLTLPVVDSTIG